jgi:hypothetical protein
MFKLDNNFLIELGLGALPAEEKNKMLAHIYETLELTGPDVRKAIKDTGVVQASWAHANKPLYWVLMMVIRPNARRPNDPPAGG